MLIIKWIKETLLIVFLFFLPNICFSQVLYFNANESPPFWSKNMPQNGLCGEILQAMSEQAGLQSQISFKPLKRLIEDTDNNDLGNPDFYLKEQDFAAIIPLVIYRAAFYYYSPNHHSPVVLNTLENLKKYKIGILKGSLIDRPFFEKQGVQFETSYRQESIFRKLKLGRIDLALEIDLVAQRVIHELYPQQESKFVAIEIPASTSTIAIMLNENLPNAKEIGAKYRQGLAKIIENGQYQKIIKKYYGCLEMPDDWFDHLQRFEKVYNFDGEGG